MSTGEFTLFQRLSQQVAHTEMVIAGVSNDKIGDSVIGTGIVRSLQQAMGLVNPNASLVVPVQDKDLPFFKPLQQKRTIIYNAGFNSEQPIPLCVNRDPVFLNYDFTTFRNGLNWIAEENYFEGLFYYLTRDYPYSRYGPGRIAAFTEDLFGLRRNTLNRRICYPYIAYSADLKKSYAHLTDRLGDDPQGQVGVVVETGFLSKEYPLTRWAKVAGLLRSQHPDLVFNFIFDPSNLVKTGEIAEAINAEGIEKNSRLITGSLDEIAALLKNQRLVLANDTGLAHIAAYIEKGPFVITPFIYPGCPPEQWVFSPRHIGIFNGTRNIPPEVIAKQASQLLN